MLPVGRNDRLEVNKARTEEWETLTINSDRYENLSHKGTYATTNDGCEMASAVNHDLGNRILA